MKNSRFRQLELVTVAEKRPKNCLSGTIGRNTVTPLSGQTCVAVGETGCCLVRISAVTVRHWGLMVQDEVGGRLRTPVISVPRPFHEASAG